MRDQHPSIFSVGRAIRARREGMKISQEDFAAEIGLDRAYYSHVERGKYNITLVVLFRIAAGLRCEPSELMPPLTELVELPPPMRSRGRRSKAT
ncbi:XRE family transcriptional regulator [Stagnimonas aquatica]|uniref:XRE family transcriptional regulator n=2 Tax=Stagnimonas aquatica TaxID=2689987 RepID=A0A3N0V1F6_9GAMM|nr:XRE family transcriptional regulator [Stagnimonas aquatica]